MLVTINTDAGFYPTQKYGSYAFWAVSNEFKICKSGVFKTKCINPDDAETRCIINALSVVLLPHKNITKVIINTDSLNAIAILRNDKVHIRRYVGRNLKRWHFLRAEFDKFKHLKITFKHVKAHSNNTDSRSWVNDWCDKECKKQLKKIKL